MIGEILTALNIAEKIGRLWNWLRGRRNPIAESVADRFVRLFESHDVHRNQIPRFFGHGLTLQDVQNDVSLLPKLNEEVLQAACSLFGVRREWLDGAEGQIYPCQDFYKYPENVASFLAELKANNPDGDLDGVLFASREPDGSALIVLSEVVGFIGEKPIYRYHLLNNWLFSYWKSRAYLTACVAIAWKHKVHVRGVYVAKKKIESMMSGEMLLDSGEGSFGNFGGRKWYPEDMALQPEVFLDGLDPEREKFGVKAGLELWLYLEAEGFMATGLPYEKEDIRKRFLQRLELVGLVK